MLNNSINFKSVKFLILFFLNFYMKNIKINVYSSQSWLNLSFIKERKKIILTNGIWVKKEKKYMPTLWCSYSGIHWLRRALTTLLHARVPLVHVHIVGHIVLRCIIMLLVSWRWSVSWNQRIILEKKRKMVHIKADSERNKFVN